MFVYDHFTAYYALTIDQDRYTSVEAPYSPIAFNGERRRMTCHQADEGPGSTRGSAAPGARWGRGDWADLADRMIIAVRPYASQGHARVTLPGRVGGYGRDIDGLEGFARTFLLAGFRLAGEGGADPLGLADWYAAGIAAGTDPASPERWVRLNEHPQAKVEAASIALVLDMTRPWIWDRLTAAVQERLVDYLAPAVGDDTYPRINWVWFRLVVQTFLRSVGGPWSADDMAEDLATHDGFVRADGWLADGAERSYDHYTGWALHLSPTLWARMSGAADLAAPRRATDVARLDRYLTDALALVGGDGSPLLQGRSLSYRFAAAAPFWIGAMAEVPSTSPGRLRHAATSIVQHFADRGVPDERGLITTGWHHAWPRLAQSYSGPSSPYWAAKGMLGLALPADHPVWTDDEEPLPVEQGDTLLAIRAPGWIVSGTRADGIVRVVNHGTDHAVEGATTGDSPLYARLGYSTATTPLLDPDAWTDPVDQSVVLLDPEGRASHRTGMRTLAVHVQAGVAVAASVGAVHWLTVADEQEHHGSGYAGRSVPAGVVTVVSLVRGPWEVRLVRVESTADGVPTPATLRIGGWAVSGPGAVPIGSSDKSAGARAGALLSRITGLIGDAEAGVVQVSDASPLGTPSIVPWLRLRVRVGTWVAALVELSGAAATVRDAPDTSCTVAVAEAGEVSVRWPDGVQTRTDFPQQSSGLDIPSTR